MQLWGVLGNLSYKIGQNYKISLVVFKNQSGTSQARHMIGRKPSDDIENLLIETRKLIWLQRSLTVYYVAGSKLIINVKGGTSDIYQQPYNSLNFVAFKTLSKHFILSFKAINLLNPIYKQTYTYNDEEYISRQYTTGRVFEIGIRYAIK